MDQTSNNQNESDEIKMSRGSVDANEGSLGSGKKKKQIRDWRSCRNRDRRSYNYRSMGSCKGGICRIFQRQFCNGKYIKIRYGT